MTEIFNCENGAFINRISKRFRLPEIPVGIDLNLEKAEVFRLLVNGRGKKKSHCSNRYPKHEGEIRGS